MNKEKKKTNDGGINFTGYFTLLSVAIGALQRVNSNGALEQLRPQQPPHGSSAWPLLVEVVEHEALAGVISSL